jgi:hypothetical protein
MRLSARRGQASLVGPSQAVALGTVKIDREHPKVADGAADFLSSIFGKDKNPPRLINGVAHRPLGAPVALELIFEAAYSKHTLEQQKKGDLRS